MISPISKTPHVPRSLKRWASKSELAIIITDPSGAVQWVNPAFTTICDYELDEIIGMKPGHFLSGPLTESHARETLNHAIRDRKSCLTRITNYKKDATAYVAQIHLEPIHNNLGELLGFLALEQDVTGIDKKERDISELSASIYNQLLTRMEEAGPVPSAS